MINVKTFSDKDNSNKKFHHVNLFGLKFRIANNKRLSKVDGRNIYRTSRGIVFNFLDNRYLCLITKR
jgi:hypothetical protein